jgi:DnaJ-class molecular chaperone
MTYGADPEYECTHCQGSGSVPAANRWAADPEDNCPLCHGAGYVKCPQYSNGCPLEASQGVCHCQNAWEAYNEDLHTTEPPLSADERHQMAWREHQEAHRR